MPHANMSLSKSIKALQLKYVGQLQRQRQQIPALVNAKHLDEYPTRQKGQIHTRAVELVLNSTMQTAI